MTNPGAAGWKDALTSLKEVPPESSVTGNF